MTPKKPYDQRFIHGHAKKLAKNRFTRKKYVFAGWAKSAERAAAGEVDYKNKAIVKNLTTKGKTIRLYAVWQ